MMTFRELHDALFRLIPAKDTFMLEATLWRHRHDHGASENVSLEWSAAWHRKDGGHDLYTGRTPEAVLAKVRDAVGAPSEPIEAQLDAVDATPPPPAP